MKHPQHSTEQLRTERIQRIRTSTGNKLAQFIVLIAISGFTYQILFETKVTTNTTSAIQTDITLSKCTCLFACFAIVGFIRRNTTNIHINQEYIQENPINRPIKTKITPTAKNCIQKQTFLLHLPQDVLDEILLNLPSKDLITLVIVCRAFNAIIGDTANQIWKRIFSRDFHDSIDRFTLVFPIPCYRQYYFQHRLSRAVEIARLLGIQENKQCVAVHNQVYDLTAFMTQHPGGAMVIQDAVGTDATDRWEEFQHSNEAQDIMKQYIVYDPILSQSKPLHLQGNLKTSIAKWQRMKWCLSQSHCFGRMSPYFTQVMYCLISTPIYEMKTNVPRIKETIRAVVNGSNIQL